MNDVERANPYEEGIQTAISGAQAKMWTAAVGYLVDVDIERQVVSVQPTVQAEMTAPTGGVSLVTLPLLLDCPIQWPRGGGCVLTFPIAPGDECLVVFASRCIDAWWQNGGVQPQAELRMHDLSDGFAIVGVSSLPNVVSDPSTTAAQLRSLDGSTVISLSPTEQTIELTAPGGATINANTVINGSLHVTGNITTPADVVAGTISLKTHRTSNVTLGGGISGGPVV